MPPSTHPPITPSTHLPKICMWLFLMGSVVACQEAGESAYLAEHAAQLRQSNHAYNSSRLAKLEEERMVMNPSLKHDHQFNSALEYLRAGETQQAIEVFGALESFLASDSLLMSRWDEAAFGQRLTRFKALAFLRLGEQENCILNHHHSSCILPIAEAAVHQAKSGSENAIRLYEALLQENPDDMGSRYLLNLAYLTLGKHAAVPPQYRIEAPIFDTAQPRTFHDIAMSQGLDITGLAGGVIAEDFNQDGRPDLAISSWDMGTHLQLFLNRDGGKWEEITQKTNLADIAGGLNLMQTDYNNDGWVDIFVLRGGWLGRYGELPNTLLRHDGLDAKGIPQFTDVTQEAGLMSKFPTQIAVWADFNNDGWLDVFIGNESAVTDRLNPSELYLNNLDGTFREVAAQAGVAVADSASMRQLIIKGVAAADYDRDGLTDLFISTRDTHNFLFRNIGLDAEGIPQFEDVTEASGIPPELTFTCWFWDYDHDGWDDLFVSGFHSDAFYEGQSISWDFGQELLGLPHTATTGLLYRNQGDGTFQDVSDSVGLGKILYTMGGNFGDIDNDGWLDFYAGTGDPDLRSVIPNRMFRFNGQRFEEITAQGFGHIQKGHGAAFADFDQDGDQDIYMVMGGFYEGDVYQNILLENRLPTANNYLQLRLIGRESNRFGIGSRVKITLPEGNSPAVIYRTVGSGGSFGANPLTLHIGIGQADHIPQIDIKWAGSNHTQTLTDLQVNQLYEVGEE